MVARCCLYPVRAVIHCWIALLSSSAGFVTLHAQVLRKADSRYCDMSGRVITSNYCALL